MSESLVPKFRIGGLKLPDYPASNVRHLHKRQIKKNKDIISTQPFETETIPVQPILSNRKKAPNTFFANVVPASSKLQLIHYSFLARQHVKRKMQMETVKDTVTLSPLQQTSQFAKTIINKSFKVAKTSVVIF